MRRAGSFSTRAGGRCSQGAWSHSCLLMGAGVPQHFHHWHRLSKADLLIITAGRERHEEKQVGEEFRNPDSRNGACVSFGASQMVKNPSASAGGVRDTSSIPGLGRSPGGGNGNHSSILAWRIPWTEEPGGLWSIGSQRVGHDQSGLACTHACSISFTRPTGGFQLLILSITAVREFLTVPSSLWHSCRNKVLHGKVQAGQR